MNPKLLLPLALAALAVPCIAVAKLAPPSDEAKAKAAEAAAKTAWSDKVASYKLCQSMDRVAAAYFEQAKKAGKPASAPVATPPCTDPGPFAYAPPLEAAGAHSPPPTAAAPPSSNQPAASAAPKK
ncbi:hypothetical protein [Ideonella sp.]|uniref:hypothetical protein n=1 Tax=Ideonella sp. TaxID=1929293 RepID=UPI002B47BDC5|nr:hypothetical protein [Ideonella sp.]HJV71886.1 hypothetical protein [Ideonella sp.]